MTHRDRLMTALEGGSPDKTPLSIYDWCLKAITTDELAGKMAEDAWKRLLDQGLLVRHHCPVTKAIEHGVEYSAQQTDRDGSHWLVETKRTPVGTLRKVDRDGWHHEYWLKSPQDYKVQQWIVEHTELLPNYEAFERAVDVVGQRGVVVLTGAGNWQHRSPAMSINVDWAGTQQFCLDVALELPELADLYAAQKRLFLEEQRLIAACPGRIVGWFENLTIDMLGPRRYRELILSVYEEAVPIHVAGGKRVMVHYDGELRAVAGEIARAPFHIIDSLTEPPEGDMLYDECRNCWPDKVFWGNVNVGLYERPAGELREAVIAKRLRAGKRAFAMEISEDLPANWQESIPVMLRALEDLDS